MRFRTLLSMAIALPLAATALAVIAAMYHDARRRSSETAEKLLTAVTARAADRVRGYSLNAVDLVRSVSSLAAAEALDLADSDHLESQLLPLLRANPGVTWISFSNPAGSFTGVYRDAQGRTCTNQSHISQGKTALVEYVVDADGKRTLLRKEPDSGYDPRKRDFYIQAAAQRDVVWLPPYVFYGQHTPGITCALALRSPDDALAGVFSVDYDLKTLSSFARQALASEHSQIVIFTETGSLVAHSSAEVVSQSGQEGSDKLLRIDDVDDPVTIAFQRQLRSTSGDQPAPSARSLHFEHAGQPYLACIVPVRLEAGPLQYVANIAPVHDFAPTAWESSGRAIAIVAIAILLAGAIATLLAHAITRPLATMLGVSERIGRGDFNLAIDLGPIREFRRLAEALSVMLANLRDWVRVRTSLQLAMEIQHSLLPSGPPQVARLDIAGFSAYCDETGGDYYDYILIDPLKPSHLIVALGDVMGHGLPSALLMAGARGILRSSISPVMTPGSLLGRLNVLLHHDTGGKRFMTMLLVRFDLQDGSFLWASAGHDPPLIYIAEEDRFDEPEGGGLPLGILDDVQYDDYRFRCLLAGHVVFIGSDGVWETFNSAQEQFGKERLKEVIAQHARGSSEEIKQAILKSLRDFRGTAPSKDDVTFVVIKFPETAVLPDSVQQIAAVP